MLASGFAIFDAAAGTCALAWNARGVAGVLPERDAASTRKRMVRRFAGAQEVPPRVSAR
jgi:methylated-DNA-[protein]-cysteine S-methyltransferase